MRHIAAPPSCFAAAGEIDDHGSHDTARPAHEVDAILDAQSTGPGKPQIRFVHRYEEAQQSLTRALAVVHAHYGDNDPRVATIVGNLALVERELGNYQRAIEFNLRDLELSTRVYGPDHPTIGTIWLNLARTTQRVGDYPAALAQVEKALAILRRHFGPQHALIMTSENSRALYLVRVGRTEEARVLLGTMLALRPESNEGMAALLATRLQLADIDRLADRFGQALALTQRVLDDPIVARNPKLKADAYWAQACVLAAQQAGDEADRARRNALQVQESDPQATAPGRLYAQAQYAACARDREGARRFLEEAVANGFKDPAVLVDPTFAAVRELPAFAAIARAVTVGSSRGPESNANAAVAAETVSSK